jgi:hypothetical protein
MTFSYFNLLSCAVARKCVPQRDKVENHDYLVLVAISAVIIGRYVDTITQNLTLRTRTYRSLNNPKRTIVALIG